MISVLLADMRPIARSGIRAMLEKTGEYQILGEASTGTEALKLAQKIQPDILVTALQLPAINGIGITQQINEMRLPTKVLLMSMRTNEDLIGALRAGVAGYIFKDCEPEEFLQAVREVTAGRRYLTAALATRAIDIYVGYQSNERANPYDCLSNREHEVLQLSAEGMSNKEIADRLCISPRTVESHRVNLMRKLHLTNQTELVRFALAKGIID